MTSLTHGTGPAVKTCHLCLSPHGAGRAVGGILVDAWRQGQLAFD